MFAAVAIVSAVFTLAVVLSPTPAVDVGSHPESQRHAREAVQAIQRRAEFLQTGVFRARGRVVEDFKEPRARNYVHESPVQIYAAFDHPAKSLRFDRKQSFWLPRKPYQAEFQFVSTPDHVMKRGLPIDTIIVYPPGESPDSRNGVFDVRVLGIANFGELVGGVQPRELFDDGILNVKNVVEFQEPAEGIARIVWQFGPEDEARRIIWFDRRKNWVPIRMEERYLMIQGNPPCIVPGEWSEPEHTCEVTWVRGPAQVWIPQTAVLTYRAGMFLRNASSHTTTTWELEFNWQCVNGSVDPETFSAQGMDGSGRMSIVVDKTLGGKPIVTQYPGKDAQEIKLIEEARANWPKARNTPLAHRSNVVWILALNLFLALFVAVVLYFRRRTR